MDDSLDGVLDDWSMISWILVWMMYDTMDEGLDWSMISWMLFWMMYDIYGQGFGLIHDIMDASLDDVCFYYGWGFGLIHDIMDASLDDVCFIMDEALDSPWYHDTYIKFIKGSLS